jgi:hypothetical protein
LNVHASRSPDTFAAEITESGATRVLPISPFGYGHDPDGAAAPVNAEVTGTWPLDLPELLDLPEVLPPLHAATSTAPETSAVAWTRKSLVRIRLTAFQKN